MQSDLKQLLIQKLEAEQQKQAAIGSNNFFAGFKGFLGAFFPLEKAMGETGRQRLGQLITDLQSIHGDQNLMGVIERKIEEFKADKSSNLTYILQNFYIRDVLKQDDKLGEDLRAVAGEESRETTVDYFYTDYIKNKSEVPMMECK
jgi:hypothetical protein